MVGGSRRAMGTRQIGILVDLVGNHGRGIAAGVTSYAHMKGWQTRLPRLWWFDSDGNRSVMAEKLDGLVASVHDEESRERVESLDVPVVNIATSAMGLELPSVISDHRAAGELAADHLAALGLKHFAYFGIDTMWAKQRLEGFAEGLAGLPVEPTPAPAAYLWEPKKDHLQATLEALREWLLSLPRPLGLFACNDEHAMMVLEQLAACSLRVPEDVAVLGADDDPMINQLIFPPLSSISLNLQTIGYEAGRLLDRLMGGKKPPAKPVRAQPARVTVRRSTEVLAVEDPAVRQAMRFIYDRAADPITVEDVLEDVSIARRTLERRFRVALGRTVLNEIHRVHVERARRLLAETNIPVARVATASGFNNATQFGMVFRKFTRQTPGRYRASVVPGME